MIAAKPRTTGRNHRASRSAVRSILFFEARAFTVRSKTLPAAVSLPTLRTVKVRAPKPFKQPARMVSPEVFRWGILSPVRAAVFTSEVPSMIRPSAGIRAPGLTLTVSPTLRSSTRMRSSLPEASSRQHLRGKSSSIPRRAF